MSSNGFTSQHASGRTPLSSVVDAMLMGAMMGAFLGMCHMHSHGSSSTDYSSRAARFGVLC